MGELESLLQPAYEDAMRGGRAARARLMEELRDLEVRTIKDYSDFLIQIFKTIIFCKCN